MAANSQKVSMNLSLAWQLASRYVRSGNKNSMSAFISKMSMLGLIVAVTLLIAVLSVMNGFEKEMRERILGLMPHITLYGYYADTDWDSVSDIVEKHPQVVATAPYLRLQGLLFKSRKTQASVLLGVSPEAEKNVSVIEKYLDPKKLAALSQSEIIVGEGLRKKLKLKEGQTVVFMLPHTDGNMDTPRIEKFKVSAFFNSGTELDEHLALVHIDRAKVLNDIDAQALRITTKNLFNVLETSRELLNSLPKDYVVSDWTESHGNLYSAIMLSKRLLMFLMFIVVFVAVFNVISSLVLLVKNKYADIAILRTLGMSPKNIMLSFVLLGSFISVIGVGIGLLSGIVLAKSLGSIIKWFENMTSYQLLNADVYPLNYLPADIRLTDILVVASVAIILGVLASLYPALKAANVMPATILSKEKV